MTYDSASKEIVLFGGLSANAETVLDDTWVWNGSNWSEQSPTTSPPPLSFAAFADDPTTGQPVLFGGTGLQSNPSLDAGYSGETWAWDGTDWTQQLPTSSPSPRAGASMAYDPTTGGVVLFGGVCTCSDVFNDTWTWNGTDWTQQTTANAPCAEYGMPMNYNAAVEGDVLFLDGSGLSSPSCAEETWIWTGAAWTEAFPQNRPPQTYEFLGGGEDPVTGDALILTTPGDDASEVETWIYQGTSSASR